MAVCEQVCSSGQEVCSQYMCADEGPIRAEWEALVNTLGQRILASVKPHAAQTMFTHMAPLGQSMWLEMVNIRVYACFSKHGFQVGTDKTLVGYVSSVTSDCKRITSNCTYFCKQQDNQQIPSAGKKKENKKKRKKKENGLK